MKSFVRTHQIGADPEESNYALDRLDYNRHSKPFKSKSVSVLESSLIPINSKVCECNLGASEPLWTLYTQIIKYTP